MAEIQTRSHSPSFLHQVEEDGNIAAVKVIWVPSDSKTGYLRDTLKLPDFSEHARFHFGNSNVWLYNSQRLDFLELNPYVDSCQITKLTVYPT